ncbi:NYN domain-containing protein [Humibacter ginsenosidimutans]|uniref:NYN domain-containing protein n=1 Tax=Humibacter ginsenosidimutans TaxID=2599293 RepID=A0A5B8M1C8_9MICO|nr:NYN domain-containing protein [Humibacter ginsenosidimutans]QDZ14618.1 NYN domain-containing protein [Humibacter ginsenosidimutans]
MAETSDSRVAVYIDFDNIVISRYDQVNGRGAFMRDRVRQSDADSTDSAVAARLAAAQVDVGAIIDFAASFGTLVLTRAYADWSASVNADYRHQLVGRAVDLVQLFPAAAYAKNGADIRLAVDAVEDMFRLPDLTHVVIVGGDSDYVPLAQRCKRLGRYVVGIGVAGSTARSLAAACDEFYSYDALPGIEHPEPPAEAPKATRKRASSSKSATAGAATASEEPVPSSDSESGDAETSEPNGAKASTKSSSRGKRAGSGVTMSGATTSSKASAGAAAAGASSTDAAQDDDDEDASRDRQQEATSLLERALRIGHEKDDAEWLHSSAVKSQIKRMDPSFSEKQLGYRSFSDFIKSRSEIADLDDSSTTQLVRLKPAPEPAPVAKRVPRRAKG